MNLAAKIFLATMNGLSGVLALAYAFVSPHPILTALMIFIGVLNLAMCAAHFVLVDKDAQAEQYSKDWWG